MTTQKSIRATSDTTSLLRALSKSFTNSTTFIGELLQNARRAKATEISMTIGDGMLEIIDNGEGIQDFSTLLSLAISGWDDATKAQDSPYGLGFYAGIFASKTIEVESAGRWFRASTASILQVEDIPIEPYDGSKGRTRIRLEGINKQEHELFNAASALVRGFPIKVVINGHVAQRQHAQDQVVLVDTRYGKATIDVAQGATPGYCYLQGLPIKTSVIPRYIPNAGIIHLDPRQYEGRMPDREELCSKDESNRRLSEQMREEAIARLTTLSGEMDPAEFIETYADGLVTLGAFDLLNSFDFIPGSWVEKITEIPQRQPPHEHQFRQFTACSGTITRKQAEEGIYSIEGDGDADTLTNMHLVAANNKLVNLGNIPDKHWANACVIEMGSQITCRTDKLIGSELAEINGYGQRVSIVETIELMLDEPERGMPKVTQVPCFYDEATNTLFVTPGTCDKTETLIYQVSDFTDGDDGYDERGEEEAFLSFRNTIDAILHPDPVKLMESLLLRGMPYEMPELLRGKDYVLNVDAKGKVTATLAETA